MRRALVHDELCILHDLRREQRRILDRHDLIVVAVQDQRRHVDLLQVFGEVRFRERLDAEVRSGESGAHALQPERFAYALGDLRARPVVAIERQGQILEELRAIGLDAGSQLIEHLDRQAAGIGGGLQHERRDRTDEHGFGDALGAVAADVAGDFAAAGGMADMDGALEAKRVHQLGEVVGVSVKVVAVPGLARAPVSAAVMSDATITSLRQEEHLVLEGIRGEGPSMAEHDRLALAPVVVVDLRTVFRRDVAHGGSVITSSLTRDLAPRSPARVEP